MKYKCRFFSANGLMLIAATLLLAVLVPAHADLQEGGLVDMQAQLSPADEQGRYVYLVEFSDPGLLQRLNRVSGTRLDISAPATQAALSEVRNQQAAHLRSVTDALGRAVQVSHHYLVTHSGVAMRLTPEDARELARQDFVRSIERERVYELSTFRGPEFMGANQIWNGSAAPDGLGLQGENMVAAILDTGVAPNHPSFANDPACGHGEGGAPDKLISFLDCQSTDGNGLCNGPSPQDNNSHGSHVASTVAGNRLDNSTVPSPNVPAPFTEISGVAPCAHVRTYHVCQPGGCPGADVQAGMNSVLLHGDVDVMNFSISGGTSPWADNDRRKLDLVDAGIFVAASAGNTTATITNPVGQVNHRGPWVASIAASTHDVTSGNQLSVVGGPQDALAVQGSGPTMSEDFTGQLRYAGDVDATNVEGCAAFPSNAFDGEAALISRGTCNFSVKVDNAVAAGATFVVVFNNVPGAPTVMGALEATTVSSVMVSQAVGQSIITVLDGATAEVFVDAEVAALIEAALGDNLANFSLRGPTPAPLQDLQKPDITAPGVGIWAASIQPGGYQFMSGTSMSGPHAAGAAVLVRQANPDWTPSEVKSALMLTAFNGGHKENGVTSWDPDDVGSGRVDLTQAALAGLVMDETFANYLAANPATGGDVKTLNLPAVRNLNCTPQCSFTRTLRNTLDVASNWTVTLGGFTPDLDVQVTPSTFSFTGDTNETVTLTITAIPQANLTGGIEFGRIMLSEDSDLAPGAHLTAAISGTQSEPAAAAIDETEFTILLEEGNSGSATFNISNVGTGTAVDDLLYDIEESAPAAVVLGGQREANPPQDISLVIDAGIATIIGVDNQEILWFNRFTPGPLDIPFTLEEVSIGFAPGNAGVVAGDLFDVHVWFDPDGDPTTGANHVASVLNQTITAGVNFQTVTLPPGINIDSDSGDVLIGVVNRTTGELYRPAVADAPGTSQQRSWIAFNFPGGVAGDPPVFSEAVSFALIDNLLAGRNWTIRGFGTGGSACLTPSDVPWLTVTPTSGAVAVNTAETVQIDVDSTGLAPGSYEARICVNTSDTSNPVFVLPVTMEVTVAGGLPTIEVNPGSLGFEVDVLDTASSQIIDIANTGNDLALDWFIEQAEGVASAFVAAIPDNQQRETGSGPIMGTLDGRVSVYASELAASSLPAGFGGPTLSVDGKVSVAAFGSPLNSSMTLDIGVGNELIGLGWEVTIETFEGSWLSESRLAIVPNPGDQTGLFLRPGVGDNASGIATYSSNGILDFAGAGIDPIAANASGEIYLEWHETFVDSAELPDAEWSDPATGQSLPPGLTLVCTDQAACDAALGGGPPPNVCDAPSDISWLDVSPSAGSTASGDTSPVSVSVDASDLEPGSYTATLCVHSNDPATPLVEVPVSLEVSAPANAARIEGTVQGLGYCQANPILAAGAGVEIVGAQETFNLTADANGFYSLFLDAANSPIDITVSAPNHIADSQSGVVISGQTTAVADFELVLEAACAQVTPAAFSEVFGPGNSGGNFAMTIDNALGGAELVWNIQEAEPSVVNYTYGLDGAGELISAMGGSRGGETVASEPLEGQTPVVNAGIQGGPISSNFGEGFDDITLLPGAGWFLQNLSDPLGTSNWFQGNPTVFAAHEGEPNSYIGANFNNTAGGTGIISNWLMTPEVQLFNGTELRFWTRVGTGGNAFPDRLEVRLSSSGSSTFAGSAATDVGDFDTLLLSVNENLGSNYPEVWTEFVVEVSGLAEPTSGRFAFRYFVTDAGPAGDNSNFIGIDTVSVAQPNFCQAPSDVPWLSVSPILGTTAAGDSSVVNVAVDSTGLAAGSHDAFICVSSNDTENDLIQVPFSIEVLGDEVFRDRFEG